MARSLFRLTVRDQAGRAVANAKVEVFLTGTTVPVSDLWTAKTGGSQVSTLISSVDQGEVTAWIDVARDVDVRITNNGGLAYPISSPNARYQPFSLIETISISGAVNTDVVLAFESTDLTIANTTTPTIFGTVTIPANVLGTNRALEVIIDFDYLNNTATNQNFSIKIALGGTTIYESGFAFGLPQSTERRAGQLTFTLVPQATANSQEGYGDFKISPGSAPITGTGILAAGQMGIFRSVVSSVDMTDSRDLVFTLTHGVADANVSFRRRNLIAKLV